jgi:hypothetical protein
MEQDFSRLITIPIASQNNSKIFLREERSLCDACTQQKISSTNNRCDTISLSKTWTPLNLPLIHASFRNILRASTMIKKEKERGGDPFCEPS